MSKETAVLSIGIWVLVLPFLGFPESWRVAFFVLTGLGLIVLGFYLRAEAIGRGEAKTGSRPFVENGHRAGSADARVPTYEQTENQR